MIQIEDDEEKLCMVYALTKCLQSNEKKNEFHFVILLFF